MQYSLEVTDLKKYFGSVKAVDGISFQVEAGTIFGMLGPNGAGKSTTIETVIGLHQRTGGSVKVLGFDPGVELTSLKKRIGVQLQTPSLFPRLTVKEISTLFASFYPDPLPVQEALNRVGLEDKQAKQVHILSGGQKHRLAIALAMISNGEMLFLDEPTTGLDPQSRRQLWDVIRDLKQRGVTVFLTTHFMDEAEKLCDQLVVVDQGQVIAQGSPRELIDRYFQEQALEFTVPDLTAGEIRRLEKMEIASRISIEDSEKVCLYTADVTKAITQLMNFTADIQKPLDGIYIRRATLEDVFLKLTGRRIRE